MRKLGILGATIGCVLLATAGIASSSGGGPLAWSKPTAFTKDFDSSTEIGVSCASRALCAIAYGGGIAVSTNPTSNRPEWHRARLNSPQAVSCPAVALCVATAHELSGAGNVAVTTNPTGGDAAWSSFLISNGAGPVSCASIRLCVTLGNRGPIVSVDPTAGATAWAPIRVAGLPRNAYPDWGTGNSVSCPTERFCVAVGNNGLVVSSNNPTEASSWNVARLPRLRYGRPRLIAVSCTSPSFCTTGDDYYGYVSTHPRDGAGSWKRFAWPDGSGIRNISCATRTLCVATGPSSSVNNTVRESHRPALASTRTWRLSPLRGANHLFGVSCGRAPSAFCVAADWDGHVWAGT